MIIRLQLFILIILFSVTGINAQRTDNAEKRKIRTLIVFFDGLRPDYITPEAMPRLHAFAQSNSYGKEHHSVYPTVTRVNSASYATGSYPATHGLMGNTVYFPEVDKVKGLNTGNATELIKISNATSGRLLTTASLGEILAENGERMIVFSSGSTGQALLQNHKLGKGAIINPELILPASFKDEVMEELGTPPPYAKPNIGRHKWVVDAFMKYGIIAEGPLVSAIWFSDPDGTAHAEGIGSPLAMQAIQLVDQQFGRVLDSINSKGLSANYNIIISTDHGFVTNQGKHNLSEFLIAEGVKKSKESDDVVVAEGAIYVKDHGKKVIQNIVTLLQQQDWVGPVFTQPAKKDGTKGMIEGTLSFDVIHWNHAQRAADILMDEDWNDGANSFGYKGSSLSKGIAGHGGASPYEIHIPLIMGGPSFKNNFKSEWPTSNVDIVPTVLSLLQLTIPASVDGRVLSEFFISGDRHMKQRPKKEVIQTKAKIPGGVYTLQLERTILGKYQYVNFAKAVRSN
jgi:predicted AlkP superfamily pyrophosphatase or phosphodiesterase